MTNEKLYQLCKQYGAAALEARRKFAGLLPEVYKRRLYAEKGFSSIFEFAAKLAGMSHEQVRMVLNLEKKFEDKPVLREMLIKGEVSSHKLVRVASIATPENQEELAEKVKVLSKSAVETFVKDVKRNNYCDETLFSNINKHNNQNGLQNPRIDNKSLPGHSKVQDIQLDVKLIQKLSPEVKQKLQELDEKGLDISEILLELLNKREKEITEEKNKLSNEAKPTKFRYIKVAVRRIIQKEHGTKCSIPGCNKPAANLHHTRRFAISHTHDPKYLAPLCKEHHQIAHTVDEKVFKVRNTANATDKKVCIAALESTNRYVHPRSLPDFIPYKPSSRPLYCQRKNVTL